jgi:hypothetical protein
MDDYYRNKQDAGQLLPQQAGRRMVITATSRMSDRSQVRQS